MLSSPGLEVRARSRQRWLIAGLLALVTALSYFDRQALPLLAGEIRKEIAIDNAAYARLNSMFLVTYGLMYLVGGRLLDVIGTRFGYTLMIAWWSAATFVTGFVHSLRGLGACRLLLGIGEGGGFPGSSKAVAEWFSVKERSFAFGLFNLGSSIGAVSAAPVLAALVLSSGWRLGFMSVGAAGLAIAIAFFIAYRPPQGQSQRDSDAAVPRARVSLFGGWGALVRDRRVLVLMAVKLMTDSVWFSIIFWLPRYLTDAHGLSVHQLGRIAWIPFLCAGVGAVVGGGLGTHLIGRGATLDRARKLSLLLAASLTPLLALVPWTPIWLALACYSLAMAGHQWWAGTVMTLSADLFPPRMVGTIGGLLGAAGALGAALFSEVFGYIVREGGFGAAYAVAAVGHSSAFLLLKLGIPRIRDHLREATT